MKNGLPFVSLILLASFGFSLLSPAAKTVTVFQSADSGPGTFRDAITKANGDSSVSDVRFKPGDSLPFCSRHL